MSESEVHRAIVELYGLEPGEFVAARNAKARELRAAGERDAAAVVAKLRRPSVNHWALNMAARTRPQIVAGWADAAATVRDAHEAATLGKPVDLRGALTELRERTTELKEEASRWTPRDDLGLTLNEIAGSADATEALRAGVLGADQHSTRDADRQNEQQATAPPATSTGKGGGASGPSLAQLRRVAKAQAALDRSEGELDQARDAVATAVEADATARAAVAAAAAAVDEARRRLAAAEAEHAAAEREQRDTSRAHTNAVERLDRAQQAHDTAAARLEEVSRSA